MSRRRRTHRQVGKCHGKWEREEKIEAKEEKIRERMKKKVKGEGVRRERMRETDCEWNC